MKIRKRILGVVLAATLVVSQAVCVFAAGSKTATAGISQEFKDTYDAETVTEETLKNIPDDKMSKENKAIAEKFLKGDIAGAIELLKESDPEIAKELEEYKDVLTMQYIKDLSKATKNKDGKYEIGFSLPNKTENTEAIVLNFGFNTQKWEISKLKGNDNQNLKAELEDPGLATVLAKKK